MQQSAEQQKAICHGEGPMMVLTGPGAGKTFVITNRVRHLIQSYGVPPNDIITPKLKYRFIEEAIAKTEFDIGDKKEFIIDLENEISKVAGDGIDIDTYYSSRCPEEAFRVIYKEYNAKKQIRHAFCSR